MATCFCGHGKKVGLTLRGPNKQGRRTAELLADLRAIHEAFGDLDLLHVLDSLIEEGQGHESDWSRVVHGEAMPPPAGASAFKKDWERWGKRGMFLKARLRKYEKPAKGRKAFKRVFFLVEDLKKRLDSLGPGEAREVGEEIYSQLEPVTRGEIPESAGPGEGIRQLLRAELWLAATAD